MLRGRAGDEASVLMRSVAIVVEGRTEERFVEEILQVFVGNDVWLRPIVAHTCLLYTSPSPRDRKRNEAGRLGHTTAAISGASAHNRSGGQ